MIKKINDYFVQIKSGYAKVNNLSTTIKRLSEMETNTGFAQAFSNDFISSEKQPFYALNHAASLFESRSNKMSNLSLEFFLVLTAKRQLNDALDLAGLKEGQNDCIIIIADKDKKELQKKLEEVKEMIEFKEKKFIPKKDKIMKAYNISEKELKTIFDKKNALELLVLEKMSLALLER